MGNEGDCSSFCRKVFANFRSGEGRLIAVPSYYMAGTTRSRPSSTNAKPPLAGERQEEARLLVLTLQMQVAHVG